MTKPPFIKVKLIGTGKEKWVNPWNVVTVTNYLSRVSLKMVNGDVVDIDYNDKENNQILNYMQRWAPPKKEVI